MPRKASKPRFGDVNNGKLGRDIQAVFEQAVVTARELNGRCSVVLNLSIYPPHPMNKDRSVDFEYTIKAVGEYNVVAREG